jgi:uncharacterized protein
MENEFTRGDPIEPVLLVQPVEPPPPEERLPSLDLIRGFCILGILLVNITFFMAPTRWLEPQVKETWWGDPIAAALSLFFAQGKMISQLAVLFGVGLALQADRAKAAGRPFTGYYLRRQGLLFLLGLAHTLLLWYGDILASYAIVGVGALFLSRLGQRGLLWCAAGLLSFVYALFVLMAFLDRPASGDEFKDLPPQIAAYFGPESEQRIYQHGSWGEMVANRALNLALYNVMFWLFLVWDLLACFLLGIYLLRRGVFHAVGVHRRFWRGLIAFGLGVGLPLHGVAVAAYFRDRHDMLAGSLLMIGALPQALGYLGLLVLWSESGRAEWLQSRLRAVGRLALTNYLMQSVLCGFIFYSYGLGYFGQWGHAAGLGVVLIVWVLQLAVSPVWLRYFQAGPVEWAWRSLADGRTRPFLRRA